MKAVYVLLSLITFALVWPFHAHAESFTYLGTLQDSGNAADGVYDFRLTLFADAAATKQLGAAIVLNQVEVHAGRFAATVDFGTPASVTFTAYLREQLRRSGAAAPFTYAAAGTTIPLGLYVGSDLWFDGSSGLLDEIPFQVDCPAGSGRCTCAEDQYSNCVRGAIACLGMGGQWTGSAKSGTCTFGKL
jgi:hypothetical protein